MMMVSCAYSVIQVVSGLDNTVEWTVGGMRRAHTQNPKENGMRTGLVWDPRSLCIVTNSNPGALQWYRPDVDQVTTQVNSNIHVYLDFFKFESLLCVLLSFA